MPLFVQDDNDPNTLLMDCPGCGHPHGLNINVNRKPAWEFNGDMEKPTFQPSVLVRSRYLNGQPTRVCHFYIRDGAIQYLPDCTHKLAGQTVPMVPFEW